MDTVEARAQALLIQLRRALVLCSTLTPQDFDRLMALIREAKREAYEQAAAQIEARLGPALRENLSGA